MIRLEKYGHNLKTRATGPAEICDQNYYKRESQVESPPVRRTDVNQPFLNDSDLNELSSKQLSQLMCVTSPPRTYTRCSLPEEALLTQGFLLSERILSPLVSPVSTGSRFTING